MLIEESNSYKVIHNTYSSAISEVHEYAKELGYLLNDDELFDKIGMGPKKPKEGVTNKFTLMLYKPGKTGVTRDIPVDSESLRDANAEIRETNENIASGHELIPEYSVTDTDLYEEQKKALHIQVYGLENGYELNMYVL
jgi:hypothetical protein